MKKGSWVHIALTYLLGVIACISMGMMGPLAGDFARAFSAPVQAVGIVIGLQVFSGAIIGAFIGWVIDRFGPRFVMLGGCGLILVTNLINIHATTLLTVGAAVVVQGIGMLGVVLGGQVTLSSGVGTGKRQVQALALWSTAAFVGVALGLILAAPFADSQSWRGALYIQVGLAAFGALVVAVLPRVRVLAKKSSAVEIFREPKVVRLAIAYALISLAGMGTNSVISLYLHAVHAVSVATAARTLGLANLAGIIGSFAMGAVLSRGANPSRVLWVVGAAGIAGGTSMYATGIGFPLVVTGLLMWTMVMGATVAFVDTLIARIAPHPSQIGATAGLVNQGGGVGVVFAAPLFFAIYASGVWIWFQLAITSVWIITILVVPVRGMDSLARASGPVGPEASYLHEQMS